MSDDLTPQDSAALIERRASPFQNYAQRDYVTYSFLDSFPLAEYGSLLSNSLYANATTPGAFDSFSDRQRAAVQEIFALISQVTGGPTFRLAEPGERADIRFGNLQAPVGNDKKRLYAGFNQPDLARGLNDVFVDLTYAENEQLNLGQYGYATLVHEILHALGLKHPHEADDPNEVLLEPEFDSTAFTQMSYASYPLHDRLYGITPLVLDIAALQTLYGANTSFNTGNNDYVFVPVEGDTTTDNRTTRIFRDQIKTIWDADGTDTFDASSYGAFDKSVTIDLREGHLSSIGGILNIAIAFGTVIENAKGGGAADFLVGNDGRNELHGNGGADKLSGHGDADTLYGGAGDDELEGGAGDDTYRYFSGEGRDTISDSDGNGTIVVNSQTLTGGTKATRPDTWLAQDGTEFRLLRSGPGNTGTLEISGPALGGSQNKISILNFTMLPSGETGALGLKFEDKPRVELLPGRAANTWLADATHEPAQGVTSNAAERLAQSFTVALSAASEVAQTVKIKLDPLADKFLAILGDEAVRFTNGEIALSIAPGQTVVSFSLLADRDVDADTTIGLTAELLDSQSIAVSSHSISLALDALEEPNDPQTTATILGDLNGTEPGRNDVLVGGPSNELIDALGGDDTISGNDGDDRLLGGLGDDILIGGAGRDRLEGQDGRDALEGDEDDDLLEGGGGVDYVLLGGAGDDRVFAGTEADFAPAFDTDNVQGEGGTEWLDGGEGRDTLVAGTGADVLTGGAGEDLLLGGAGADFLFGDSDIQLVDINMFDLGEINLAGAADTLFGGGGDDELAGEVGGDTLLGGAGADLLFGDSNALAFAYHGDDFLDGGAGNDALQGQGGNDSLLGGAGDDLLQGDDEGHPQGDDYLDGEDGDDTLIGGGGADVLFGGAGADVLAGDADGVPEIEQGSDELYGEAGDDLLQGYGGEDFLDGGEGADTLIGGLGRDTLYGGADNDALVGDEGGTSQAGDADLLFGEAGDDVLGGQGGADQLYGGDGDDQLTGGEDADFLDGGPGADVLLGDAGADLIDGGAGADQASGGDGDDVIFGGADADVLLGDAGADELNGDDGDDTLQGGDGDDRLAGGEGADQIEGGEGADTLIGGAGADTMTGGAGDDVYEVSLADGDRVVDAEGENVIRILDATAGTLVAEGVTIDGQLGVLLKADPLATTGLFVQGGLTLLDAANPTYELAGGSVVSHAALMEEIYTASASLTGTAVGDALKGYAGADLIQGLAGDDWLSGGGADDVIEGGDGNDELVGGAGADILRGGLGDDSYTVDAADTVEEFPDEGTDTVLSDSSYTLGGNLENLTLTGETAIDATGNTMDNTLTGNDAANVLRGLAGADALSGGGGADTLEGGVGDDLLAGGAGDDEYLLSVGDGADTIEDASGLNAIRFGTGIDASSLTIGQFVGDDGATYLRIGYGTGGDAVAIRDGLLGGISEYRFADGTVRTHEDILASVGALAVQGTGANDTIVGGASADVLDGAAGADQLFGRGADDLLRGGEGDDVLWGEAGNDVLDGGPGADTLTGGTGEDTYLVSWGMGEDTIVEDPGGLNRLRLGTAVAFEDLVPDRIDDDLVLSLRGGSNRLALAGYYGATQDWLVTDSASETRTLAEVIAQSPSGPPDPVEAAIASYKARVLREFYSTQNYTVLGDGALERSFSRVTGSESNSTHSTYVLQELVQASDEGYIGRGSASVEETNETTVTESTMTVYVTQPGSRAVAEGLAAHGAANDVNCGASCRSETSRAECRSRARPSSSAAPGSRPTARTTSWDCGCPSRDRADRRSRSRRSRFPSPRRSRSRTISPSRR